LLKLRSAEQFGDAARLRNRINGLLEEARHAACENGIAPEDVDRARFAVVAFADETVLKSDWPQKEAWMAGSLQFEIYERYDAGEEFFNRLEQLRADPSGNIEVLEVYYLCLALGFQGRYQLQNSTETAVIAENIYNELKRAARAGDDSLSAHGTPGDQAFTRMRNRLPAWAVAAFTVVFAGIVYLTMSLYASSSAERARAQIQGETPDPSTSAATRSPVAVGKRAPQSAVGIGTRSVGTRNAGAQQHGVSSSVVDSRSGSNLDGRR
jgi:type VI secretion system protein ImpK